MWHMYIKYEYKWAKYDQFCTQIHPIWTQNCSWACQLGKLDIFTQIVGALWIRGRLQEVQAIWGRLDLPRFFVFVCHSFTEDELLPSPISGLLWMPIEHILCTSPFVLRGNYFPSIVWLNLQGKWAHMLFFEFESAIMRACGSRCNLGRRHDIPMLQCS